MSESQEAAEAVEEQEAASETAASDGASEPEAEPQAELEAEAEAEAEAAPEPEADEEPDPAIAAAEAELAEEAIPTPVGPAAGRQATVFLCDRGHRTVAIWSQPTTCHARPTRHGGECGRQLHPIGGLPDQVQRALNPLKASKKGSKG